MSTSDNAAIWVDGEPFQFDDFTFRERKLISTFITDFGGNAEDPVDEDFLPACVAVIKRRKDPNYDAQQALDLKPADLVKPVRPTRPAGKAKTSQPVPAGSPQP